MKKKKRIRNVRYKYNNDAIRKQNISTYRTQKLYATMFRIHGYNSIEIKEVNFHVPKRKMGEKSRGEVP